MTTNKPEAVDSREAFEAWYIPNYGEKPKFHAPEDWTTKLEFDAWQAAWQARGEHDAAELAGLREALGRIAEEKPVGLLTENMELSIIRHFAAEALANSMKGK